MGRHIKLVRNCSSRFLAILCNVEIISEDLIIFFLIIERKRHSQKCVLFPDVMGVRDNGSQAVFFQVQFCCVSFR